MHRSTLVAALLLLSPASRAQSFELEAEAAAASFATVRPSRIDLSWQFDGEPRNQGDMSSCHTFVAVALLEAAYFRRYGLRIRLSEADLFVRRTAAPALPFLRARESGMLRPDLRHALEHGVMPGDFYEAFEARYHAFKRRFFKFLDKKKSVVEELLPESATPEADAAREKTRAELEGFSIGGESFFKFIGAAARSAARQGVVSCDQGRVARLLERQLDSGRPVGVGLNSGWTSTPAWRRDADGEGASHYFVVSGYERASAGTVFRTRNTWSEGGSPDLSGSDLCEVFAMTWVRAPTDK